MYIIKTVRTIQYFDDVQLQVLFAYGQGAKQLRGCRPYNYNKDRSYSLLC